MLWFSRFGKLVLAQPAREDEYVHRGQRGELASVSRRAENGHAVM